MPTEQTKIQHIQPVLTKHGENKTSSARNFGNTKWAHIIRECVSVSTMDKADLQGFRL